MVIPRPRPQNTGFTLIELLVVMSIIGILAGMLFPAISMIKKSGRKSQCANNMRQLGMGIIQYAQGNNSTLPGSLGSTGNSWDKVTVNLEFPNAVMQFPFLKCPEDNTTARDIKVAVNAGTAAARSYVMTQKNGNDGFIDSAGTSSRLLVEATVPDSTILLTESWTNNSGPVTSNTTQGYFLTSFIIGYTTSGSIPQLSSQSGSYYHGSSVNYLMADGRLQTLNPKLVASSAPGSPTDPHWAVIR